MTSSSKRIAVVGAGWSGAVVARELTDAGYAVEVFERADRVGGHSRSEVLNGIVYEPNGAHIFHTSNARIAEYVMAHGLVRPYEHKVLTEVFLDDEEEPVLLSWPPQIGELEPLPIWPSVKRELDALPAEAAGEDFETYVISMMGETLYRLFIRDYTVKQWGCDPTELSSGFAPKRVELRDDGYRRLFRDRWEFFPAEGVNGVIESVLRPVAVTSGATIGLDDLDDLDADAVVITAPLDDFVGRPGTLAWRGITMRSRYVPTESVADTVTAAYVVNRPSPRVPYTRTVETKHASGQLALGTVVSEEFPGAPARHYPVPTVGRTYEAANERLKAEIREASGVPVFFCGRLANYLYINQDQAIEQGFACAEAVRCEL
jgi:UDP-galactopyranose mutase